MAAGQCHLCLQTKELMESHLIPAAFYRLLRTPGEKNPNPVVVNPTFQERTSKQVTGRMLCGTCEARFNLGGENWVLRVSSSIPGRRNVTFTRDTSTIGS